MALSKATPHIHVYVTTALTSTKHRTTETLQS